VSLPPPVTRTSWPLLGLALVLLLVLAGCAARSDYMQPVASPQPVAAPADAATVVFLRPARTDPRQTIVVTDEQGRFLGDAAISTRFVTRVAPGEHIFMAWAENTGPMRATLAPGRIYYVLIDLRAGVSSGRADLLAVTPRSERWKQVPGWLSETEEYVKDEAAGQVFLTENREEVQERLQAARTALTEFQPQELSEHTLVPEDGAAGQGAAPPPVVAQPAVAPAAPAAAAPATPAPAGPYTTSTAAPAPAQTYTPAATAPAPAPAAPTR
jgi:hypothetical protein